MGTLPEEPLASTAPLDAKTWREQIVLKGELPCPLNPAGLYVSQALQLALGGTFRWTPAAINVPRYGKDWTVCARK